MYGEEVAFSIKAIPPEFRALASGTVVLDSGKRGRFLFEWAPMDNSSGGDYGTGRKYRWDATTRFALTAEEAASLLARLDRGDPSVELSRRLAGDHYQNPTGMPVDKIFMAKLVELEDDDGGPDVDGVGGEGGEEAGGMAKAAKKKNNGISLLVDYVDPDNQRLGQIPHSGSGGDGGDGGMFDASEGFVSSPKQKRLFVVPLPVLLWVGRNFLSSHAPISTAVVHRLLPCVAYNCRPLDWIGFHFAAPHNTKHNNQQRGPFEIRLMIGEYQVLRSILEYSIPRLVGWSTMFDRNIEQAINRSLQGGNNYRGGGGGGYRGPSPHNYQGSGDGGGGY